MKNKLIKMKRTGYIALGFAASGAASAKLPDAASTAIGNISTGVTDAETAVWPVIGAALVASIIIKLVKRFANKV
ncbi:hypothetical protein A3759_03785 [Thalassolituus sp. HI0120]|jgi:hypothetical protein|nr:hypothetical protein A3759_03785 [Thalassolituus sp. HI0120]